MARIEFTPHAVERYVQRHAPHLHPEEALDLLEGAASSATRLKKKSFGGQLQWKLDLDPHPPVILITKKDRGQDHFVCVTILPRQDEPEPLVCYEEPWEPLHLEPSSEAPPQPAQAPPEAPRVEVTSPTPKPVKPKSKPAKTPPVILAIDPAIAPKGGALKHEAYSLEAMWISLEKARLKTVRHLNNQDREISKSKQVLRRLLKHLAPKREDPEVSQLLAEVATIEPGFLSPGFIDEFGFIERMEEKIHVWWTSQKDEEAIGPELPERWPAYLVEQYRSRRGRDGRGRIWAAEVFKHLPEQVVEFHQISTPLSRYLGENCAGILIHQRDTNLVFTLPGVVTDTRLRKIV